MQLESRLFLSAVWEREARSWRTLEFGSEYLRFSDLNHEDREVLEVLEVPSEDFVPFAVENLR